MNKKLGIIIIIGLLILIGIGIFFYVRNISSDNGKNANYQANRTSSQNTASDNKNTNAINEENASHNEDATNSTSNNTTSENTSSNEQTNESASKTTEKQISAFSTKIYTNDSNRTKNMEITTSTLNDTIVKKGETFSFCNTVGPATSSKGYLEADIYDHNGNKKKGYGGGNCQVSSTLYNAVLEVPNLTVVEKHPHSNHVPYVPEGKDAAVAYGSYDFKFKNDTENDVKILASVTEGLVNITLMSI